MQFLAKRKMEKTITLKAETEGRADYILSASSEVSRSRIKNLADEGSLSVNGKTVKGNYRCKVGDEIILNLPEDKQLDILPVDIPLDIVYQDDDVAVINKPQGLTVHAGSGTDENTLVNALLYHVKNLSGINGVIRPGIVHRIDKNTSGLLVVAKNDNAHVKLAKQLEDKTCRRIYVALLEGVVKEDKGVISTCISRDENNRTKMRVSDFGREAITKFKVLQRFTNNTLCEFSLKTGRTHQIRVHAKYMGHPVVGDKEYGFKNQKFKLNGQLLHAKELTFVHPTSNERVTFSAPLPDYFENILNKIK